MKRIDLGKIKKTRFCYEDVLEIAPELSYEALHEILEELCREELIAPVKNAGRTSFVPQVYREYRKVAEKKDYSQLLPEIRSLHPRLSIDKYLKKPKEFQNTREYVMKLSDFLWREDERLTQWMSVKEKSYAIWGEEKFLESSKGRALLAFHGLDKDALHYYYAPEPFFCRVFQPEGNGDVLILENKDSWYSIGKALRESPAGQIFGITPGLLVYGEGKKITREQEGLTSFLEEMGYGGMSGRVYYAGDIDRAGVTIFYGARKQNPGLSLEPWLPLYHAMLQRALEENKSPQISGDGKTVGWNKEFLEYFTQPGREFVRKVLDDNRRIPQEILNYQDYRNMCRG